MSKGDAGRSVDSASWRPDIPARLPTRRRENEKIGDMNTRPDQNQRSKRIAELVDTLQATERELALAGKANALGFEVGAWEKRRAFVNRVEWVRAFLNPLSLLNKSFSTLLERGRSRKEMSGRMKSLFLAVEACLFWSSQANKVVRAVTPLGVADVLTSVALKATTIGAHFKEEELTTAMDNLWRRSQQVQRLCPAVIEELNREIELLS